MIWIYPLTWQEWILGALFLLSSAVYLYKLNAIAKHLKTTPHTRVYLKFILRSLIIVCAIVALLGPSFGYIKQDQIIQSRNWHLYVDVSQSMAAQDIAPSRLEEVKKQILNLSEHHTNDLFSLSVFGPSLLPLCPLTSDKEAYSLFLNQVSTKLFQYASSNGKASFQEIYQDLYTQSKEGQKKQSLPLVVFFTDGEFHTPIPPATISALKKLPYHFMVVGAGSSIPSPIPSPNGYLKDQEGKKVLSQLDRSSLRQLAHDLKGTYFDAHEMDKLESYTEKLPGINQSQDFVNTSMNKYFYFLILSFLFMIMDIVITVKTMTI